MFSVRTARGRAIFGSAVLVVLFVGIAAGALWRVQDNQERDERLEHTSAAAVALEHARAQTFLAATWVATSAFADDPTLLYELYQQAALVSREDLDLARAQLVAMDAKEELAAVEDLGRQMDELTQELETLWAFSLTADRDARIETAQREMARLWPIAMGVIDNLERLAAAQEADLTANIEVQQRGTGIIRWVVVSLISIAFLVAAGLVALVVSVVRPLAALRASARAITAGDLEARASVSGPEEVASLARDFNEMTDSLAARTKEYIDTTNLTGVVLLRTDKDNRVTFLNDAMCQFLGRPREEVLGTDIVGYLHPDDATSTGKAVQRMIESKGLVTGVVTRYVTPMGIRVTEWSGHPIFDEEGRYAGLHGTGRDVSERERMEEALRTKDCAIEASINGIALADPKGVMTYVNPSLLKMWGYDHDSEMLGRHIREFWQDREKARQVGRALRDRGSWIGEMVGVKGDGSAFDVQLSASRVTDALGKPVCIMGSFVDISERKQAEEELRESEERYRLLAENATDVIWTMDMNLRRTYVSPSITQLRGYTVEEVMAQTLEEVFTPASLEVVTKTFARERAIDKVHQKDLFRSRTLELEQLCKDGSTVWTEVKVAFLRDADGRPVGIMGVTRDITEHRRAEEALRESEERYRLLAENATDVIWTMDTNLRVTYVSPSITRLRGYTVQEVMDQTLKEMFAPASLKVAKKVIAAEQAIEGSEEKDLFRSRTVELEQLCKDGSTVWTEVKVTFPRDADGRPVGIMGVTRDISERKRAEKDLRRREQEILVIAENVPALVSYVDADGRYRFVNKRYEEWFGVPLAEITGKHYGEVLGEPVGDLIREHVEAALSGQRVRYEAVLPYARGGMRWVNAEYVPDVDDQGKVKGFFALITDISERKRAEDFSLIQRDLALAVVATHELQDTLRLCVDAAIRVSGMDCGGVYLVDERSGALDLVFHKGLPPDFVRSASHFDAESANARLVMAGKPVYSRHQELGVPLEEAERDEGLRAIAVIPVPYHNRIIACINIASHTLHEVPHFARSALETVATQIGNAIARSKAEQALRESEEQYRTIFEQAADSIVLIDAETGAFVEFNDGAHQALGYSRQEFEKLTIADFEAIQSPEEVAKHVRKIVEEGAETFETKHRTKDGDIRDIQVSGRAISLDGRHFVQGIWRDVTERKRAEEALRESEGRFRGLAEATFEGIVIHHKCEILDANQAFANMFGYELAGIIGMHILDFAAPESRDLASQRIVLKSKEPFELMALRKDGSTFAGEVWGTVLRYRGRNVTVAAIRDVSERKRAEEALQRAREEIESRVERRVQEVNGYGLTFRELTVLHLVAAGESDKEIAVVLGISPLTAHKHLANILEKMGASCRTEAGVRALREGLLD